MIEEIAQELDSVRNEMLGLLQEYPDANEFGREYIYQRCESLGGEIQELVGLLKMHIRNANREVCEESFGDPAYVEEIQRVSQESLSAIHAAGVEVAGAIKMLRDTRDDSSDLEDPGYHM